MDPTRRRTATRLALLVCLALALADIGRGAEEAPHPLVGRPAPELEVERWDGLVPDRQPVLARLRGQVAVLFFFQSWCPGCHSSGFPLFRHLEREFGTDRDVQFLYVQTTFEGHARNTFERGLADVRRYELKGPFGQDRSSGAGPLPVTMRRYRSGGTPWVVLVDRAGIVRFAGFGLRQSAAVAIVKQLIAEPAPPAPGR